MNVGVSTIDMDIHKTTHKKALLIRNAASYDFGGAERFVVSLGKELAKNGWDTVVVTAHHKTFEHAKAEQQPVIKGLWWSRQDWSGAKTLLTPLYLGWQIILTCWYLQLFLRLQPDVVHPQSKDDFIAATIAGKLTGKKIIWTDHADLKYIFQNAAIPFKNPIGKLVRWCSRFARAITLVSNSEGQLITTGLGTELPSNYQVIYNGITDYAPPKFERPQKDKNALIFCITSRLVTAKGIGELIQAFQQIDTANMRLWILGEGPEAQKFKGLAANNTHIEFLGFPDNSLSILQSADIFVHPSYHEGFSISILEATMLGKPIIACKTGGNPEIVHNNKNGLLVPVKDVSELAKAMKTLASDEKLREQLGREARRTFERSFQFNIIVKKEFIPLYED